MVACMNTTETMALQDLDHKLSLTISAPTNTSPFPSPSSAFLPTPMHDFVLPATPAQKRALESKQSIAEPKQHISESRQFSPELEKRTSSSSSTAPTSSRPAPPSPAVSRPISTISTLSTISSSRPSRTSSTRRSRLSTLSLSTLPIAAPSHSYIPIHIRDYAFEIGDLRREGRGNYVPKVCRPEVINLEVDVAGEEETVEEDMGGGWGAFAFGMGRWSISSTSGNGNETGNGFPTKSDLERNFGAEEEEEEEEYVDAYEDPEEERELFPGMYRALYAFEPEGPTEMALAEDQVVRVLGRGGGMGWAVVEREQGVHALVPEGFLEVVKLDDVLESAESD